MYLHKSANTYIKGVQIMNERKKIPLDEFTLVIEDPGNRLNAVCVNILDNGRFNMNGKLTEKLGGKRVRIAFTPDGHHFTLNESKSESAVQFPKSGSKMLEPAAVLLRKNKIIFPARYEVWHIEDGDYWQGDYVANPMQQQSLKPRNSKKN